MGWGTGNIGGGSMAGLDFEVVQYATEEELLASKPKDNTIGVITTTDISGWAMGDYPDPNWEMSEGFLYINIKPSLWNADNTSMNILKKENEIWIAPISAKQYVSGTWVDVTCKSYQNGAWADWWNGELYDSGNIYEDVTGGWTSDETAQIPTITYNATTMEIKASASGYNRKVRTGKKIDMRMWSSLVFDGTHTNAQTYNTMGLLDDNKAEVASVQLINGHELDISAFTGMYYVFFQVRDISRPTVVSKLTLQ